MKVTIDSTEPLADALRVIGALYNVTLTTSDTTTGDKERETAPSPQRPAGSNRKPRPATKERSSRRPETVTSKRAKRQVSSVSISEIRRWAKDNGHAVRSRGTLPASVRSAYADAHTG